MTLNCLIINKHKVESIGKNCLLTCLIGEISIF